MSLALKISPCVSSQALNGLFASAWPDHTTIDFRPILERALVYVCAFEDDQLVGFAKVISDGGIHGFLLDPTVTTDRQRSGIGRKLVMTCIEEARNRGVEWLHVDYVPALMPFYNSCGFRHTEAGLLNLKN